MSKRFRAAIIGCGAIAGGYDFDRPSSSILTHAKAYKTHSAFDLIACVEPDIIKRNEFMRTWDIPFGYSNLNELDGHFDVVSVCVPTAAHADTLDQLLVTSNYVVWTEKPLTDSLERSKLIVSNYEKSGRALVVNYPRRWAVEIQKLKSSFEKGNYGNIQKAVVFYSKGLLNNGSHALDLLEFILGPLLPISCLNHGSHELFGDQNFDVQLSTMDRKPIYMFGCNSDFFSIFEIQIICEKGRISLMDSGFDIKIETVIESERFLNYKNLSMLDNYNSGLDVALFNALNNIHGYLLNSMPLLSTGRTALSVQELCTKLQSMSKQS